MIQFLFAVYLAAIGLSNSAEAASIRTIQHKLQCRSNIECGMIKRHIARDSRSCQVDPQKVEDLDRYFPQKAIEVSGSISFLGFYPGQYFYRVFRNQSGQIVVDARVHIKSISANVSKAMRQVAIYSLQDKLKIAAEYYTRQNPYSTKVKFQFSLTKKKEDATVSVALINGYTRGPYFSRWSMQWSTTSIIHEMGHILGMDDEYTNLPRFLVKDPTAECDRHSVMCMSYGGGLQKYHYYLIFRRLLCQSGNGHSRSSNVHSRSSSMPRKRASSSNWMKKVLEN